MGESYSILCLYDNVFIHSPTDGNWIVPSFDLRAAARKSLASFCVRMCFSTPVGWSCFLNKFLVIGGDGSALKSICCSSGVWFPGPMLGSSQLPGNPGPAALVVSFELHRHTTHTWHSLIHTHTHIHILENKSLLLSHRLLFFHITSSAVFLRHSWKKI